MTNGIHRHINIMEELVAAEVSLQLENLPKNFVKYRHFINPIEVETYALNHLPPLYASTMDGKSNQLEKGKTQLTKEIHMAVTRAIASVMRDPLKKSEPLLKPVQTESLYDFEKEKLQKFEQAIQELQVYLQRHHLINKEEEITAENLLALMRNCLRQMTAPTNKALRELEEYLLKRRLIGVHCQLHLDNLLEVTRLVVSKLNSSNQRRNEPAFKQAEKISDLEFYLSMKDEQPEVKEHDKITQSGTSSRPQPISKFGQLIRDNFSGQVMNTQKTM